MILKKREKNSAEVAASFLREGKIVILPTDTVYGFSGICPSENENFFTEKKIQKIKGGSEKKPLIELVSKPSDVFFYTDCVFPSEIFSKWPGPLTVIVENNARYKKLTGRKTTAFRCPADEWLCRVIELCGRPIFSTSANKTGEAVLPFVSKIRCQFESQVDLIVDGGDRAAAVPSRIISLAGKVVRE